MRIALFSHLNSFEQLKTYLQKESLHVAISHTKDIKCFFTILFRNKKIDFDMVVIEESLAGDDLEDLLDCTSSHFSGGKIALLSSAFDHSHDYFTFDLSEHALKRFIDRIKVHDETTLSSGISKKIKDTGNITDIEYALRRYERIINGAGEAIVGLNESGCITFLNATACELLGRHEVDLLGQPLSEFALDSPMNKGVNACSFTGTDCEKRRVGRGVISKPDGSMVYVEYTQSYVGNREDDTVSIMVIEDIGDRVKFEAKLKTLANRDPLTGLANRRYFQRALCSELSGNRHNNGPIITALIDLDNFKQVNDQYGHTIGDKLLILTAKRLVNNLRRGDLVARLGGDEFVMLFKQTSAADVEKIIENTLNRIQIPFNVEDRLIKPSASIGLYWVRDDDKDFDTLLQNMDKALYEVKHSNKGQYQWYTETQEGSEYKKLDRQ